MMKYLVALFLLTGVNSWAQMEVVTTFILVRHAEKGDDGKDPDLSEAGKQRALQLAHVLKEVPVDAIYTTPYKRTRQTVTPLAQAKEITIAEYTPMRKEDTESMLQKFAGGTIVVAGHSNTIPGFANYLIGNNELKNFDDADYDNLLVVTVVGKTAKVIWLSY